MNSHVECLWGMQLETRCKNVLVLKRSFYLWLTGRTACSIQTEPLVWSRRSSQSLQSRQTPSSLWEGPFLQDRVQNVSTQFYWGNRTLTNLGSCKCKEIINEVTRSQRKVLIFEPPPLDICKYRHLQISKPLDFESRHYKCKTQTMNRQY